MPSSWSVGSSARACSGSARDGPVLRRQAARDESPIGTASRVDAFVVLECPGPWGRDALRDSRLPEPVKQRLRALDRGGIKAAAHPPRGAGPRRAPTCSWLATGGSRCPARRPDRAPRPRPRQGRPPQAERADPLYLVCTHGRHDVCCAERGRPLWKAAHAVAPEHTWQSSHLGGDRFAGNLLVLPAGLYYGRVAPESAAGVVAAHERGELDLAHLRGRSSLPFAAQAAEILLRRHLGLVDERPAAPRRPPRPASWSSSTRPAAGRSTSTYPPARPPGSPAGPPPRPQRPASSSSRSTTSPDPGRRAPYPETCVTVAAAVVAPGDTSRPRSSSWSSHRSWRSARRRTP